MDLVEREWLARMQRGEESERRYCNVGLGGMELEWQGAFLSGIALAVPSWYSTVATNHDLASKTCLMRRARHGVEARRGAAHAASTSTTADSPRA